MQDAPSGKKILTNSTAKLTGRRLFSRILPAGYKGPSFFQHIDKFEYFLHLQIGMNFAPHLSE
jgi:hypothetical protein